MAIIKEWKINVSINRDLIFPREDNETNEEFIKWATSSNGTQAIQEDFTSKLRCYGYPKNADLILEDIELKETEVKSSDADPKV